MTQNRITQHPILPIPHTDTISIFWNGERLIAQQNETIAAVLFANGIRIFGHHHKDESPQGIFCANGQCSQCLVLADGLPVKACMETVRPDIIVEPLQGLPPLPKAYPNAKISFHPISEIQIPVLIIGGGPAGLAAAIELGKDGIQAILIDDKSQLGGKLVLQTHRFFGSTDAVYAGTRGIDIAHILEKELTQFPSIDIWLRSTALAVFSDKKVGILRENKEYSIVIPQILLVTTGAREKFLTFKGNALPGVFGAGAFQTLVNRDLVRPSKNLFIVGGGNVGLIAGYHALQANISVAGLVEALPECGGYKVHRDKLARMGVPIYTSHTVLSANGKDGVESITIAKVDEFFRPIMGTERTIECDSVLIAVGLDPVDEFYKKAVEFDMEAFTAGDAEDIAEASAAIFSGKIKGREIAQRLGIADNEIPSTWYRWAEILKSKPGRMIPESSTDKIKGVFPILHCNQEIPCDPCSRLCDRHLIRIDPDDIREIPTFFDDAISCSGCFKCVTGCPGLAITVADFRRDDRYPTITIPYEFISGLINPGDMVILMDTQGNPLGKTSVRRVLSLRNNDHTYLIQVQSPTEIATSIAGIQIQPTQSSGHQGFENKHIENDEIVCLCERVTASEIRELIKNGCRDMNEIKTISRAGMGACGGKTCSALIVRLFRQENIPLEELIGYTKRPLFMEVTLGVFAGFRSSPDK